MTLFDQTSEITLPYPKWQEIVKHCRRIFDGILLPGESSTRSAYGLITGIQDGDILKIERILPCKKNIKDMEPYRAYLDDMKEKYAAPSRTPFAQRGWMTDPEELKVLYEKCDREELIVFGTYHTHYEPWEDDPTRDTPTNLDAALARNTRLFSFIVSMTNVDHPGIRAFYEGLKEKETRIVIDQTRPAPCH